MSTDVAAIMKVADRPPVVMVEGHGSWLQDEEGKTYLDFVQGWAVNCLGHSPPAIVEAIAFQADVTRASDCAAMVEAALDRFGRLDFLDNNVGIGSRGSVVDETEESWRRLMTVNVDSMFLAAKHAIPAMRRAGGGAIVNVSSISALRPRGLTAYSVSKGAVIALTRAMAVDHGPEGIRVNCVAPGPVYTPMVYQRGMSPASRDRRRKASALGIEGTGWDIGHAVRFLLSDFARYITGHTLVVDGGTSLSAPERDAGGSGG